MGVTARSLGRFSANHFDDIARGRGRQIGRDVTLNEIEDREPLGRHFNRFAQLDEFGYDTLRCADGFVLIHLFQRSVSPSAIFLTTLPSMHEICTPY